MKFIWFRFIGSLANWKTPRNCAQEKIWGIVKQSNASQLSRTVERLITNPCLGQIVTLKNLVLCIPLSDSTITYYTDLEESRMYTQQHAR